MVSGTAGNPQGLRISDGRDLMSCS